MRIIRRMKEPTPRFFRKLRNGGIALAGVGGAILAAPVVLPTALVNVAGYFAVAGTVASVVSQAVTGPEEEKESENAEIDKR